MRKLISVAGAAMLAVTTFATPASAAGTASGSCGPSFGSYEQNSLFPGLYGSGNYNTVPEIYFRINWSGVEAPNTIGYVIWRDNETYNAPVGSVGFPVDASSGSFQGSEANPMRLTSNFANPTSQGGEGSLDAYRTDPPRFNPVQDGPQTSQKKHAQGISRQSRPDGGVAPGAYHVYIYTGSGLGGSFKPDVSNPLGKFWCAVEDDQ